MDDRKQSMAEARRAEKRGDFKSAGDLFARAGASDEAARAYLAGGEFAQAAQTLLRMASEPGRADRKGLLLKAAICFSRAGDVPQAVRSFLDLGERQRAVELLRSLGDATNAARVEADHTGRVQLIGYASAAQPSQPDREAARRLEGAQKLEAALEAYAGLRQWSDAARIARTLGKHDRAGAYFAEAGKRYRCRGNSATPTSSASTISEPTATTNTSPWSCSTAKTWAPCSNTSSSPSRTP